MPHAARADLARSLAPVRFLLFGGVFIVTATVAAVVSNGWRLPLLVGFDTAAAVFLISALSLLDDDVGSMRRKAKQNDANRSALLAITVLISIVILFAIGTLVAGKEALHWQEVALIVGTLATAWLFANTVYALHYAHLYYMPGETSGTGAVGDARDTDGTADATDGDRGDRGGLAFPNAKEPDYWDFLYFSFTLGMTFQTSDVAITGGHVRRVALGHTMAAFLFNMGILAFTVNALGGL